MFSQDAVLELSESIKINKNLFTKQSLEIEIINEIKVG
jgi:hypothetical protein